MTPADAAELLTLCAALDRRTIGEADARAWAFALRDIPLDDDTRAAVADHYAHTEKWITPAHVKQIRARTRETRIGVAHPVYDGTPDETGAEFTARRREQLAAAANGTLSARSIAVALDAAPPREVLALAAGIGRPVDDEPRPYITEQRRTELRAPLSGNRASLVELAVDCPTETCRAGARHLCRRSGGVELRNTVHGRRRDAYAVQFATCPECGAPAGQYCTTAEPHPARIRNAQEIAA
ncbi:zinc finger domain-containing protein [Streptomyces sp. NPDC001571]